MSHKAISEEFTDTLIIGAGQAGLQLATSLRQMGDSGSITIIGGEERPPYQRPPLSKAFLHGEIEEHDLMLRGADFYAENDINMFCGEWVERIALDECSAGIGKAKTRSGQVFNFSKLAFTVGGTPRRMKIPGAGLTGVHYLRTLEDAIVLKQSLDEASRVVVVGGGFVGLEIAAAANAGGKSVTVLEAQDRLMARAVAPEMSRFYADAHRRRGTNIVLNASVSGFHGTDHVTAVELSDGRVIDADVVVVGIGLIPHTELAAPLGLASDRGIEVDIAGQTRIPGIVAAGDCAMVSHPIYGTIRLESVPNAIAQAKVAAATLLGRDSVATVVPWFWSDQADIKLQMAGLTLGYDSLVVRGDPASECFSALYYRDAQLVSIESVNAPRDYMAARRILETGGNIPFEQAGDTEIPLKTHIARAKQFVE